MICLDTNIVIAILNRYPVIAQEHLAKALYAGVDIAISAVVLFELQYGAARGGRPDSNRERIDLFLAGPIGVLPFDAADAAEAAAVRHTLSIAGTPIGPYDTLIAGQARRRSALLATANRREFDRVPGLQCADWTKP